MTEGLRRLVIWLTVALAMLWGTPVAADSQITISDSAIRKILIDQLYTDNGKYHLLRASPCQFAYLESPVVVVLRGRVHLRTRLTGMLGAESATGCNGTPESFHVTISGRPYFSGEFLGLSDLRVDDAPTDLYKVVLQSFLDSALPRAMQINLREGLEQMLAAQGAAYDVSVEKIQVSDLSADNDHIRLDLSFSLFAD